MRKYNIIVPENIKYLGDWTKENGYNSNFRIFNTPYIINKQLTGCGFTQFALMGKQNVILCSPRRVLLESKYRDYTDNPYAGQLPYRMLYAKNNFDEILKSCGNSITDNPMMIKRMYGIYIRDFNKKIYDFIDYCKLNDKSCKILVTYDSFSKIKQLLIKKGIFEEFNVVVDEFQSIFLDSSFKSNAESNFLTALEDVKKLCYVSATPMIEKYLDDMREFRDLPYVVLDWGNDRVPKVKIKTSTCKDIVSSASVIIDRYRKVRDTDKYYATFNKNGITSKEAVIYVNSVKTICEIIRETRLKPEEVNIICADTDKNRIQLANIFMFGPTFSIGEVPALNEPNKMITLCTSTVYLGADFYSNNARSFVFADMNVGCMALDLVLQLPQILGRQRLDDNPWKNEIEVFYKFSSTEGLTEEEIDEMAREKLNEVEKLIEEYEERNGEKLSEDGRRLLIQANRRSLEVAEVESVDKRTVDKIIKKQFNI